MSPPLDLDHGFDIRKQRYPLGGGGGPPSGDPWTWPNASYHVDADVPVTTDPGPPVRVRTAQDRVGLVNYDDFLIPGFPLGWVYVAGVPNLFTKTGLTGGTTLVNQNIAGGWTPAADMIAASTWTMCHRLDMLWSNFTDPTTVRMFQLTRSNPGAVRAIEAQRTGAVYTIRMTETPGPVTTTLHTYAGTPADGWTTIQVRSDGTDVECWLDGVLATTTAYAAPVTGPANEAGSADAGSGNIGDTNAMGVKAGFTRALTDAEMLAWHNYAAAIWF